jgi:N4-gp56 family major capsid protein
MAEGNFTPTTSAAFIPEIWSKKVLSAVESNLVMARLVTRDFEGEIEAAGDVVHVPTLSNLTAASKEPGTDVTYSNVSETTVDITIDSHRYVAFVVEDIVRVQSNVDLIDQYTAKAGYALAKSIDSDLLALYSELSTSVGTGGSAITDATVRAALLALDEAEASEDGRSLVIAPSAKSAMLAIDKFINVDYRRDDVVPVQTGRFGEIYGVDVFVTNQVPTTGSSTVSTHNLMFHSEAFALAVQVAPRVLADPDLDKLGTKVVVDVLYGVAVLRDAFAVEVLS